MAIESVENTSNLVDPMGHSAGGAQDVDVDSGTTLEVGEGPKLYAEKYKTVEEMERGYKQLESLRGREAAELQQYRQAFQQMQQEQQQRQTDAGRTPPKGPWERYGFEGIDDFGAKLQEDPAAAFGPIMEGVLGERLGRLERMLQHSLAAQRSQSAVGLFPEFNNDPRAVETARLGYENNRWIDQVAQQHPHLNPVELAYKLQDYGNQRQERERVTRENEALKKRLAQLQGRAGLSSGGGGGATRQLSKRPASVMNGYELAVQDLEAQGESVPWNLREALRGIGAKV